MVIGCVRVINVRVIDSIPYVVTKIAKQFGVGIMFLARGMKPKGKTLNSF